MSEIVIQGGNKLKGELTVQGAKNSVLPILAATVLNGDKNIIHNCPDLSDVRFSQKILNGLGCETEYIDGTIFVNSSNVNCEFICDDLMREMRSSVTFLGAILSRCGSAVISHPGGCNLGPRPIDLHLDAFEKLGVKIKERDEYIHCEVDEILGKNIHLNFPSVGATENIMLLTACSTGETVITNAACEPEIVDLQNYLNCMGSDISGAGTETISIRGVSKLKSAEHSVIPDRVVAATYLCCVAAAGGEVLLKQTDPEALRAVLGILRNSGCKIKTTDTQIYIEMKARPKSVGNIITAPHPGFPTDAQALMMSVMSVADGTTVFTENIFESRFKHTPELVRMGADISASGSIATVRGTIGLTGANVRSPDLRGGAALVIAGLAAQGTTRVTGLEHIDRGYENIVRDLAQLGADIKRT